MFDTTASLALDLQSPRAQAFAMLGAAAMVQSSPQHRLASEILNRFPISISRCSTMRAGPNGAGSRSCWPMTTPACRRRCCGPGWR
ncbi:hypothetical protein AB5I41_15460 [Sphingomonas sp. MMS24-JH45]